MFVAAVVATAVAHSAEQRGAWQVVAAVAFVAALELAELGMMLSQQCQSLNWV